MLPRMLSANMGFSESLATGDMLLSDFKAVERGVTDAVTGHVRSPCSMRYLHMLYLELSRARSFVLVNVSKWTCLFGQEERLGFLKHEFDRLLQHPGLFPSAAIKARFVVLCFHLDCEYQFKKAAKDLLVNEQLRIIENVSCKLLTRPSYLPGSHGWENFLLPGAPGAQLGHAKTEPASAFQVLPGVGMRICSDFAREENDIIQYVYGAGANATIVGLKSLPSDLDYSNVRVGSRNGKWPNVRLRHHTTSVILSPSPFREDLGIRLDIRSTAPVPLKHFSSMIYRVEQQGPGPNAPAAALNAPNVFPVMGIRSWHRPLRRWDLHYHTNPIEECSCRKKSEKPSPPLPTTTVPASSA